MGYEFRALKASEVEARVGQASEKGVSLLLYKDARVDMKLLDEIVGAENWTCAYEEIHGNLFCGIGIRAKDGSFVWKWDCGVPSNMEAEKGEASDAFKRAGTKWGIGRELYNAPFIWVPADKCNISRNKAGKPTCYDRFSVRSMTVEDGCITALEVWNDKRKCRAFLLGSSENPPKNVRENAENPPKNERKTDQKNPGRFDRISELKAEFIENGGKEEGIRSWLDAHFKGKAMRDFTDAEIKETEEHLSSLVESLKQMAVKKNAQ